MHYNFKEINEVVGGIIVHDANNNNSINHLLIDTRKILFPETSVFFAIKGSRNDGHLYVKDAYDAGIRNFITEHTEDIIYPNDINLIVVKNTTLALQQLAAHHRNKFNCLVTAITGSNGKTVTKEWLSTIYATACNVVKNPKSYNSQIGVPLSVWQINTQHQMGFFEAGISEPGEMQRLEPIIKPEVGLFTFLGNAHNEGFHSVKEKLHQKLQLFKNCNLLIYCKDQPEVDEAIKLYLAKHTHLKTFSWSKSNQTSDVLFDINYHKTNTTINFNNTQVTVPFSDEASVWNICSCLAFIKATAHLTKIDASVLYQQVKHLQPIEMRMQLKEGINNCMIINDSYSADLDSLQIALNFLQQQSAGYNKTLIISDFYQSGITDEILYPQVASLIQHKQINKTIAIGANIGKFKHLFSNNSIFYPGTKDFLDTFNQLEFNNEIILLKGARHFAFEKINRLLEKKIHETVFEINLNALVNNLNVYKKMLQKHVKLMAMVKAFSYGAGSFEISKVLEFNRIDYLAVAYADEGVVLRKSGIKTPIMVMNPELSGFDAILTYNLEPEIYNFNILEQLIFAANGLEIGVHIEIDSGMKRLGFNADEISRLLIVLKQHKNIQVKSVFTHLAASDEPKHDDFTKKQIDEFNKNAQIICNNFEYPVIKHCLNSSGITRFKHAQFDMVRLGIGLYGIDPSDALTENLQHIGTLKTVISQIRNINPDESIGYGRKGKVNSTAKIAITAIGYADGLNRLLSNGNGYMLVNGKKAPIVGNICMDMTMVDVTEIDCKEGDEVIVFGKDLPVNIIAERINTIPYEILTSISQRVKRIYYYE